jgi:hypothetical protein
MKKLLQSTTEKSSDQIANIGLINNVEDRNQISNVIPKTNIRNGIPIDSAYNFSNGNMPSHHLLPTMKHMVL